MYRICFSGEFFMPVSSLCPVCGINLTLHVKNEKGEREPCLPQENVKPIPLPARYELPSKLDWAT